MALKKYFAELAGTAALVFLGCGSAVLLDPESGHLAVALAFGLAVVAMAYVIGGISGCHINPAVSLAVFLTKKISARDLACYVLAQIAGAVLGAALLKYVAGAVGFDYTDGLGANGYGEIGVICALVVEIILTFIFVFAVLGVTSDDSKKSVSGIVIGLTLTLVHIVGIPLTGTSVNPARSIGPAIFAGTDALSQLWVFIVGPLAGAALAFCVFTLLNNQKNVIKTRR